jgi:DNA-binding transcriptional LysR family regulator
MGMEDHKLRVFCTVAETRSFSKASEIIHLTQPAVSLQIQALEEQFETKLFDRSSNTVSLTPAGEILYKYAKQILGLYAEAERAIGDLTGLVKGSITVGASSTIGNYLLPAVVSEFRRTYPRIKIHLLVGNTKRIVELLKGGIIDVGLVEGDVSRYKLTVQKLISDELALIVSAHHPWAALKEVSMLELPKEPFIFREEGSGTRQMIERHLQRFGLTAQSLNISAILGSTEAIKEAVEAGIGVSILSRWTVRKELRYGSLRALRFREGQLLRDFSLLFNKNTVSTYSVETFLSFLRNYPYEKLLDGALP